MRQPQQLKLLFMDQLSHLYDADELQSMWRWLTQDLATAAQIDAAFDPLLAELKQGRPYQYVMGEAWFMGMKLYVDESVLIPRPETEELVDRIARQFATSQKLSIIDIGTGSGCIPLALKKLLPQARIHALDVSAAALQVARKNATTQELDIQFMQADILEWEVVFDKSLEFDVIVSNPPYITPAEKADMTPQVLQYEPELALFVEQEAPLLFYQYIADFARHHLRPSGKLFFEINRKYGAEIVDLLKKMGFEQVLLIQDMQGADRMIEAQKHS